jgi:hypothetical protein
MIIAVFAIIIFALMAIAGFVDLDKLNKATEKAERVRKFEEGVCLVCGERKDDLVFHPERVVCYDCQCKDRERKKEIYRKTGKWPW